MINDSAIKEPVRALLAEFGWSRTRRCDPSSWIGALSQEGYKAFPYAISILENFGGIKIVPERKKLGNGFPGDVIFDPTEVAGEFDRVDFIESKVEEEVFPLGMVFGQWFLYVGASEKIYMAGRSSVFLLGNCLEDFLNNLIMGDREPIEL